MRWQLAVNLLNSGSTNFANLTDDITVIASLSKKVGSGTLSLERLINVTYNKPYVI